MDYASLNLARQSVLSIYYPTLSYWSLLVLFLLTFGTQFAAEVDHLRITAFVSHYLFPSQTVPSSDSCTRCCSPSRVRVFVSPH